MAFNPTTGKWEYEDASVGARVANIARSANPLIAQARAQGVSSANRRGLLNSSMAVGASQAEAYRVALPIASQEAQQIHQTNLAEQDRRTQLERLGADAGYQASRQGADIAAQMERLRAQAGFSLEQLNRQGQISTEQQQRELQASMERLRETGAQATGRDAAQFGFQTQLNREQAASRMAELQASLAGSDAQQRRAIEAEMARLRESGAIQSAQNREQFGFNTQLNAQQAAARMEELRASLAGADAQQTRQIEAEMARLRESGAQQTGLATLQNQFQTGRDAAQFGYQSSLQAQAGSIDRERITLQGNIEAAMQASGAEQQRALAVVQGDIQRGLQTLANDQQLQRMGAEFTQQTKMQADEQRFALERLRESGNQEVIRLAAANAGENQRLAMSIAAGDRQAILQGMTNIFQAEASMRNALLSNPNMPAAERAAYEAAISSMGNPARTFLNQLYTPPANATGGGTGQPIYTPPPGTAPAPPPAGVAPPAPGAVATAPPAAGPAAPPAPTGSGPGGALTVNDLTYSNGRHTDPAGNVIPADRVREMYAAAGYGGGLNAGGAIPAAAPPVAVAPAPTPAPTYTPPAAPVAPFRPEFTPPPTGLGAGIAAQDPEWSRQRLARMAQEDYR